MKTLIDTLAQLQKIRHKAVQDRMVTLAQQKQKSDRFESNIKALGMLMQKTTLPEQPPTATMLKNIAGYKGTLQRVLNWQKEEHALAQIKEKQIQQDLVAAACREKVVSLTLASSHEQQQHEFSIKQQKASDDIAGQCWLRQRT